MLFHQSGAKVPLGGPRLSAARPAARALPRGGRGASEAPPLCTGVLHTSRARCVRCVTVTGSAPGFQI